MKKGVLLLMALVYLHLAHGQDPEFTQFYANPVYLNPALAGSEGCPRLQLNHRNQWPSISGAFVTNTVSYDQYVNPLHGGIGVTIMNDMAGQNTINWSTISLVYSYHLQLGRRYSLLFGAKATWNQKFLDWNKLSFGDQIDPYRGFVFQSGDQPSGESFNNGWSTKGFFDVSAGLVLYSKNFYAGFATHHLNTPNQSLIQRDSELPRRYTAHVGTNIPIKKNSKYEVNASISPNIIYTYQIGAKQINLGTYFTYGVLTAGVWWRPEDAFMMTVGLAFPSFSLGYSYDITISRLSNASGGAHEISLGFQFPCKTRPKKFRTIGCPSF